VPKLPFAIATVGFDGKDVKESYLLVYKRQMAVADPAKHLEFAGTVKAVDTRDFWRQG